MECVLFPESVSFHDYCCALDRKFCSITNEMKKHIVCPICKTQEIPSTVVFSNHSDGGFDYCLMECSCTFKWYLCCCCDHQKQPKHLRKRDFKKSRSVLKNMLHETINSHYLNHHYKNKDDCASDSILENKATENDFFDAEGEFETISVTIDNHIPPLQVQDIFPTEYHGTRGRKYVEIFNLHRQCKREGISYPSYLVKEYWCKNHNCEISDHDIDLFLLLMKRLIVGSRKDNVEMVSIIDMIEMRNESQQSLLINSKNHAMDEINRLKLANERLLSMIQNLGINMATEEGIIDTRITASGEFNVTDDRTLSVPSIIMRLPRNPSEARSLIDSKNSLVKNLCTPLVMRNEEGYAYCLPSEAIKIALAVGLNVEQFHGYHEDMNNISCRSIFRSQSVRVKIEKMNDTSNTSKIVVGLWSDGCEAGGMTKGIRSSVKLTTVHVCNHSINQKFVFPVALGSSKADHDDIRKILWDDINYMCRNVHNCVLNSADRVIPTPFVFGYMVQDRPEHGEWTGFASHNGIFSCVPGYSFPIMISENDEVRGKNITVMRNLSSCERCILCRKRLLKSNDSSACNSSRNCDLCDDWDITKVRYIPHPDYPKDAPQYSEVMDAKKVTFSTMKDAINIMNERIWKHKWSKAQCERYAKTECIRNDIVDKLFSYIRRNRPSRSETSDATEVPEVPEFLLPIGLKQDTIELDDCMIGAMHTVVLNLGRHYLDVMHDVLSQEGSWRAFYDDTNKLLKTVRSMSLSWCKVWTYGSRANPGSQWVSENYLGLAVASKMMLSTASNLNGLSDHHKRVITETYCSYNSLIARIMCPKYASEDECKMVEGIAKQFLSNFHELDSMVVNRSTSKIESASCLLNLLTVGQFMKSKGIVRNFWEGDVKGEGILRVMKPLIKRGIQVPGTMKSTLEKMYNIRCISDMIEERNMCKGNDVIDQIDAERIGMNERYRSVKSYGSIYLFNETLVSQLPFAAVYMETEKSFYVLIGNRRKRLMHKILLENATNIYDTVCVSVNLAESVDPLDMVTIVNEVMTACIFIPLEKNFYCIRNENHEEVICAEPLTFGFPLCYQSDSSTVARQSRSRGGLITGIDNNEELSLTDFRSREFCKKWVNRRVHGIEGCNYGRVTRFHYKRNVNSFENCVWTVKYYLSDDQSARARKTSEVGYDELRTLIVARDSF